MPTIVALAFEMTDALPEAVMLDRAPRYALLASLPDESKGLFRLAQAPAAPTQPAPSASVANLTMYGTATRRHCGMESPRASAAPRTTALPTLPAFSFASHSKPFVAVPPMLPLTTTSAPGAEDRITALKAVLSLRSRCARTPLVADAWECALRDLKLHHRYPTLPDSIRFGFHAGVPRITTTFTPSNSPSFYEHSARFEPILRRELDEQRYIGPLSRVEVEFLIGPFQTSPLSLIPKPHKPDAYRVIQNLSFPRSLLSSTRSINFAIISSDYPCTWGTFTVISLLIWSLPRGSEGACRDVSEAFRRIPLDPSQWPGVVVRLSENDEFLLDTCTMFGIASGTGVFGQVGDALVDILRGSGIGPVSKWVDDHVFFRIPRASLAEYNGRRALARDRIRAQGGRRHDGGRLWFRGSELPDGRIEEFDDDHEFPLRDLSSSSARSPADSKFTYCLQDVNHISERLGIPWELEKDIPFSPAVPFTGLSWDISTRTVSLVLGKREKYLSAIAIWKSSRTHTLDEVLISQRTRTFPISI